MNSLSWMIYLADVAGSVSTIGIVAMILSLGGGIVAAIACAVRTDFDNLDRCRDEKISLAAAGWRAGKGFFLTGLVIGAVLVPIPSREAVYAIAASELGEEALNTETGGKAVQALNAWLDRQISGETAE